MEILAELFGNGTKVKLMRLFLFNQDHFYPFSDIVERVKASKGIVRRELSELMKIGIVRKRDTGYAIDQKFPYLDALQNLLTVVSLHADEALFKKFTGVAKLRLFVASGIFLQEWYSRIDLLIVGDKLNFSKLEDVIKIIESEVGREISYSAFETDDFEYRYGMHDRLIRDIFDLPHKILLNKLDIEEK